MELEVGMYVRTKITDNCNCVYIRKITEIDDSGTLRNQICIDEDVIDGWGDDRILIDIEDIAKASHNLLGNDQEPCLIEVGDYVNGDLVLFAGATTWDNDGNVLDKQVHINHNGCDWWLREKYIKSIVTKEQFESMQYRIGE